MGTPALMMEFLLEALRIDDQRLNELAAELFTRCGPETCQRLAWVALDRQNSPEYRVRALQVFGRMGIGADPDRFLDLLTLVRDNNAEVRAAAGQLIGGLPHTKPPNVGGSINNQ
jgi:hypothetical protein